MMLRGIAFILGSCTIRREAAFPWGRRRTEGTAQRDDVMPGSVAAWRLAITLEGLTWMADRYTHMVGGFPGRGDARAAMAAQLRVLGDSLLTLPDGERATRQLPARDQWIQPELAALRGLPGVISHNETAGYTGYDDYPWYEASLPLKAQDFAPVVILQRAFEESYPVFSEVRREAGFPGLRFQAGLPAPLDVALFGFRAASIAYGGGSQPGVSQELHGPIVEAKARQVLACHAQAPGDVVFQLESPAAVVLAMQAADQDSAAAGVAGLLTELPRRCPGTRWGVHLCNGDLGHKAATDPRSALPLAILAGQIAAQWPGGPDAPVLEYVHLPFAAGGQPPALDPGWYKPLGELSLPPGCRLAAGFVHEGLDLPALRNLLGLIEEAYGAEVSVAATCGMGRWPDLGQAYGAMRNMAALSGCELRV